MNRVVSVPGPPRFQIVQKTICYPWVRDRAGIEPAKPLIAVPCYPVVSPIPERSRDQNQRVKKRPRRPQKPEDAQGSLTSNVGLVLFNECHGGQLQPIQAMLLQEVLAGAGLKGGKTENFSSVVIQDPTDRPIAEAADTVKKDNRSTSVQHGSFKGFIIS